MLTSVAQQAVPVLRRSRSAQKNTASSADRARAINVVKDDESFASALLVAIRMLFGNECLGWEPESFWVAFETEYDLDVSTMNRNKLLSATTLVQTPRFYADANVFEKTCLAFNDVIAIPAAINEASPAQMAWGVFEAELVMQSEGVATDFDHEPTRYAAVSMGRDGFVLAPGLLVFAQDELYKRFQSPVGDVTRVVQSTWEDISRTDTLLRNYPYETNQVGVQLAKLASVELYVRERAARYQKALADLL